MAERVKAQIRQSASSRRERQAADHDIQNIVIDVFEQDTSQISIEDTNTTSPVTGPPIQPLDGIWGLSSSRCTNDSLTPGPSSPSPSPSGYRRRFRNDTQECDAEQSVVLLGQDFEADFLMKYLDYVFPFMFPFYRPSLLQTGRSWLLPLLKENKVAYHSTLSLSSYFFTAAISDSFPGQYSACKSEVWKRLGVQADRCFEIIQHDIRRLNEARTPPFEKARVMEGILQFLLFDVTVSKSATWNVHLTAALALFEDILRTVVPEPSSSSHLMLQVLNRLYQPSQRLFGEARFVWMPEQAGFRFFTAVLVYMDTIASTALEKAPVLLKNRPNLLEDVDNGVPDIGLSPLQLSSILGFQNWVILAIGKIASLDAWKKEKKTTGSLSMMELIERASGISRSLEEGISRLGHGVVEPRADDPTEFRDYFNIFPRATQKQSTTPTRIWAHAAQLYLSIVICGWQPSSIEARSNVTKILKLLQDLATPAHLRTLAWPICVAGCMATAGEEEKRFRRLFTSLGELGLIGALGEAQRIVEKVWGLRDSIDRNTWDLAACFRILGAPVLLC